MATPSGGRSTLNRVLFEANGKVKCTDISIPSTDFKAGKMKVLRLGNALTFSVAIEQIGQRSYSSKKTIAVSKPSLENLQRYEVIVLSKKPIMLKLIWS